MRYLCLICLMILLSCAAEQKEEAAPAALAEEGLHTEVIDYTVGGTTLKGYLAYDKGISGKRPGVLVVHEWWGQNDYSRKRAEMLAELGYTALALDMYGDGKSATHPEDAQKFMMEVMQNLETGEARFNAALELLKKQGTTDPERIAAIGYCFGGAVVLHMARLGTDLDGVVSFHGNLSSMHQVEPGSVKARVLVAHGAADPMVPAEQVAAFKKEMEAAKVDYRFEAYEGALHAFTNPAADENGKKFNIPLAYDADADKKSWESMKAFFTEIF